MTNPHHITTSAAVILSVAAVGAPAASARPADVVPTGKQAPATAYSRPDKSLIAAAARTPAGPTATASQPAGALGAPAVQQPSARAPFDWGDAGIGAAGLLMLVGVGSGAAVAHRRRADAAAG